MQAIRVAADKRLAAAAFQQTGIPTPHTALCESFADVIAFVTEHSDCEWCLKFPTGCGGNGHRLVTAVTSEPPNWPRPWIVQEFVRLARPEVFRLYGAGRELFGWIVRRFPAGFPISPWVAHARGALYECLGDAPPEAVSAARGALEATGLWDSFGCVDLLRRPSGEWLVLEVGTDGLFNHVDRDLEDDALKAELSDRIARAFWNHAAHLNQSSATTWT